MIKCRKYPHGFSLSNDKAFTDPEAFNKWVKQVARGWNRTYSQHHPGWTVECLFDRILFSKAIVINRRNKTL